MTEQEYRSHPGVNKSTLWEIRKSPLHYKYLLENPSEDTPALKLGRAIHMAVLQPNEFDDCYAVAPDVDRRKKEGKQAWEDFLAEAGNKEILTADEYEKTINIAKAVVSQTDIFNSSQNEVPLFWDDQRTGIGCKCRLDAITFGKNDAGEKVCIIVDLKTADDAGLKGFTRNAVNYGYHVQAAHYINGVAANDLNKGLPIVWKFVVVEKKPPYAVNIITADQGFIDEGQFKLMELMDKLDRCLTENKWPGYGKTTIIMPQWAVSDFEEEE